MSVSASTAMRLRKVLCLKDSNREFRDISLDKWELTFSIYKHIEEIKDIWNANVPQEAFMTSSYLRTLEQTNPSHLSNLYVVLKNKENEIKGVVLLQSIVLDFSKSFNYERYTTKSSFLSKVWQRLRQIAVSWIKFRLLVVGNLYLTGQYGMHVKDISTQDQYGLVQSMLKVLKKEFCSSPYRFSGILYKDFFEQDALQNSRKLGLEAFKIDPNMILPLKSTWSSFDDYLADISIVCASRMQKRSSKE
jgi:hypothetical protein